MTIKILRGSCLDTLKTLPEQSINTCITSPPYWGLRDYGESDQLGLEETPEEFVENLVQVFREVKRVLRDDGTVWLNLGDSYSGSGEVGRKDKQKYGGISKVEHLHSGKVKSLPSKNLVGIPWRVAFALQADGWYLRQDIIWHKPNPMPESVRDRCTKAHEYIFLLSKSPKYYFDNEAVKEDSKYYGKDNRSGKGRMEYKGVKFEDKDELIQQSFVTIDEKRNKRSVWTVTTKSFEGAHFATFPPDLIEPCVLAGCPLEVCAECNEPYVRQIESKKVNRDELDVNDPRYRPNTYDGNYKDINGKADAGYRSTIDMGLQKQCDCKTDKTKSGTVLDPFGGSGTTAQVALGNSRDAVLCELNDEYIEIAKQRIAPHGDLFIDIEVI
jgi:DNA modification methylase